MREKYESLSLAVLKELAKSRGLKGISTLKKAHLWNACCRKMRRKHRGRMPGKQNMMLKKNRKQTSSESVKHTRQNTNH